MIYKEAILQSTNRRILLLAILAIIAQFLLFKWFYPFPDFIDASYDYIYAASVNLDINIQSVGYSGLLRILHSLSHSDMVVVAFQYFFLELSAAFFFITVLYCFNPGKANRVCLFISLFANPLFLYLSNRIGIDSLMVTLSLIWFTVLIWIMQRPRHYQVLTQAILLVLLATLSNIIFIYLVIGGIAFLFSTHRPWIKSVGIVLPLLLVGFCLQRPLFAGWKIANNALYMYRNVIVDTTKLSSSERELNQICQKFYARIPRDFSPALSESAPDYFIQNSHSPLNIYYARHYQPKDNTERIVDRGKEATLCLDFGRSLITSHPLSYFKYFVLPNMMNYFLPPLQNFGEDNGGEGGISYIAQDWFDYKLPFVYAAPGALRGYALLLFPYAFFLLHLVFGGAAVWLLFLRKLAGVPKPLLLAVIFLMANFLFGITTTTLSFIDECFPMILLLSSTLLLLELVDKKGCAPGHQHVKQITQLV